jgi:hypothetical protein|tara:strand:- start:366 stop:668 length:303 start_codon:yes stop_codon:yes gene_type:complete
MLYPSKRENEIMDKIKSYKGIKLHSKLPKNVKAIVKLKNKYVPVDYSHPAFQYTSQRKPENFVTNKNFWITAGKVMGWSFIVPFAIFAGIAVVFGGKTQD